MQTLASVQGYQHTASNINHIYRPLAIALLFGLIMLAALLVCVCACVGRTPRLTAFLLVILWILTGAILFIGAGLPWQEAVLDCTASTPACAAWAGTKQGRCFTSSRPDSLSSGAQAWCRCRCRWARTRACTRRPTSRAWWQQTTAATPPRWPRSTRACTTTRARPPSHRRRPSPRSLGWTWSPSPTTRQTPRWALPLAGRLGPLQHASHLVWHLHHWRRPQVERLLADLRNPNSNLNTQLAADPSLDATDKANIQALVSRVDSTTAQVGPCRLHSCMDSCKLGGAAKLQLHQQRLVQSALARIWQRCCVERLHAAHCSCPPDHAWAA